MNCVSYPVSGHNNGPGQPPQLHGCPTLQNTHRHIITYSFHTPAPAHCSSLIQSLLHLLLLCHSYPCQRFARSSLASLLFLFQPACNRPNTARMWGDWCSGFACLISGKRFANQAGVIGVVCRDLWFNFELRTSPVHFCHQSNLAKTASVRLAWIDYFGGLASQQTSAQTYYHLITSFRANLLACGCSFTHPADTEWHSLRSAVEY